MSLVKTETRSLICILTDQDLIERGDELAKTYIEIAALDMQKKRIAAQIKPKDERIEQLVVIIDTKEEERRVDCQWQYEWDAGVKKLIRMDTGFVVDTGEIRDWERQQQLPITAGSYSIQDLADVCPKCDGDGRYYEEGIEDGGGEVYCDCLAGIALKEDEANAGTQEKEETEGAETAAPADGRDSGAELDAPVKTDCTLCRTESGCDQCCKTCEAKCNNEMICRVDEAAALAAISLCAVCLGLCGDFTPGTQVSECAGYCDKPSEEQIQWRDNTCNEWKDCPFVVACFGPSNEENPVCFKEQAAAEAGESHIDKIKAGRAAGLPLAEAVAAANKPTLAELCASCHKATDCDDCCCECISPCNTQQKCTWPGEPDEKATAPEAGKMTTLKEAREKRAKLIKTPKGAKK